MQVWLALENVVEFLSVKSDKYFSRVLVRKLMLYQVENVLPCDYNKIQKSAIVCSTAFIRFHYTHFRKPLGIPECWSYLTHQDFLHARNLIWTLHYYNLKGCDLTLFFFEFDLNEVKKIINNNVPLKYLYS